MRSILARTAALKAIEHAEARQAGEVAGLHRFDGCVLFAGSSEVVIAQGADLYRLRFARRNKLILTR